MLQKKFKTFKKLNSLNRSQKLDSFVSKTFKDFWFFKLNDTINIIYQELEELKTEINKNNIKGIFEELGNVFYVLSKLGNIFNINCDKSLNSYLNRIEKRLLYVEKKYKKEDIKNIKKDIFLKFWKEAKTKEHKKL